MSQDPNIQWCISEATLHAAARRFNKDPEHIREICRQNGIQIIANSENVRGVLVAFRALPGSHPPQPGSSRDFECSQCHSPVWIAPESIPQTHREIRCTQCLPGALPAAALARLRPD